MRPSWLEMRRATWIAMAAALIVAAAPAKADNIHIYSYDPADSATRRAAGPLTFTFKKGLLHNTLLNVRSTEAEATAFLHHEDERTLGPGGIARVIGRPPQEHDLYEVEQADDGAAMISAFCPGATRAWMAFGALKLNRDLTVLVLGAPAKGGGLKVCRTLQFSFHGEWLLPPTHVIDPRQLEQRRFPG